MIRKFQSYSPEVDKSCFIADSADVIGKVKLCEGASVWFGAVVRGDSNDIYIGRKSNVQDNCTIHAGLYSSVHIGDYVTIGHNVVIHGHEIGNCTLIGMGSIVMNGSVIGSETIIGAGSIVTENKTIPSGVLCVGSPARVMRRLTDQERLDLKGTAEHYFKNSSNYADYNINRKF
ncbi:gamma carbonic anhydrase family protein [Clostridium sp. LBM24168]